MIPHLIAITLAFFIDWLIGDPPTWPHPVRWMGSFISLMENKWNKGRNVKGKGVLMVISLLTIVFVLTFFITSLLYHIHVVIGIIGESIIIASTIAHRNLKEAAMDVYNPLQKGDLEEARLKLSYIVGRDTKRLDEREIVRGTVETVAENTSDGVTAPLFWALFGGAPFAVCYRAINTCDSMVGYKNERFKEFGWASARLDDVVNFFPSRITAFLIVIGGKSKEKIKETWHILHRDWKKHPSPNSGWLESAVAGRLNIQLGGVNVYNGIKSERPTIGNGGMPLSKKHILQTNQILTETILMFISILWIGGVLLEMAIPWS